MKKILVPLLSAFLAAPSAPAAGVWITSSWDGGFTPAANNALLGRTPNPASGLRTNEGSAMYGTLTDGAAVAKDKEKTTCLESGASLTYALGAGTAVYEVRIYSTWSDAGRDTLSVSSVQAETDDGQTVALSPSSVSFSGNNCCACATLKMADGTALCSNASTITFNFGAQESEYVGYSELEVLGEGGVPVQLSHVIEIPSGVNVATNLTPDDLSIWGPNGGNLTISGSGVVVTQNVPVVKTMADVDFGQYWPWIEGTVTVENGATLESNTQIFRGSGVKDEAFNKDRTRKLVVRSGASAVFSPATGDAYIVGLEDGGQQNAWVVVTGTNSTLTLPASTYLGNKVDYAGHSGKMEVLDGGRVEGGTFYVGYHTGGMTLSVDGGSMKWTGGIYGFKNGSRWTGATILFKDCVVETPFYKMAYPHGNGASSVTFDGAVFRAIGIPPAKFIDASPAGDPKCPHYVTGGGLVVDAPIGASLEVSAMLQGAGGFTKRGAGAVTLSAPNAYTGTTTVEAGTLNVTGSFAGPLAVSGGEAVFSGAPTLPGLAIASGGSVTVTGIGANVGAVSDYAGEFVVAGVADWPQNSAIVSSSTGGFLEKIAAALNASETVPAGYSFQVRNGSVQLVEAGVANGTIAWNGTGGDALWSTGGNWDLGRCIHSGDALVVAAGGVSTNDLGSIAVESAAFSAGTAAHTVGALGASGSLKINGSVSNLSASAQTFDLPVSIGEPAFAVHAAGDLAFPKGLAAAAGVTPAVAKTGAGALVVEGCGWGGTLALLEGEASFLDVAGAPLATAVTITNGTTLRFSGAGTAVAQNVDASSGFGSYWPWCDGTVVVENGATLTSDTELFWGREPVARYEGMSRLLRIESGARATFAPASGTVFMTAVRNGAANSTVVVVSGPGSELHLPASAWLGNSAADQSSHPGAFVVTNGAFVSGGRLNVGHRTGDINWTVADSVLSFPDGIYVCPGRNADYQRITASFDRCIVTTKVWRTFFPFKQWDSRLAFDGATFVPTPNHDEDFFVACPFVESRANTGNVYSHLYSLEGDGIAFEIAPEDACTVSAAFTGTGGLTKLGAGTLSLSSTNEYAGATVVSNGTLRLTGRVAGPIAVAPGATLALPIPAAGEEAPVVPSIVVEPGGALAAIVPGLPQGVACVDVLRTTGTITLAPQAGDSAHKRFFVGPSRGGMALRYGNPPGMTIIIR